MDGECETDGENIDSCFLQHLHGLVMAFRIVDMISSRLVLLVQL
jgi:hypothetical protein